MASDDGRLAARSPATGHLNWCYDTGSYLAAAPIVEDGAVFLAADAGVMHVLNVLDGQLLARYEIETDRRNEVAVIHDALYNLGRDGNLSVRDSMTGAALWGYNVGFSIIGPPVVVDGSVYVRTRAGTVYALSAPEAGDEGACTTAPPIYPQAVDWTHDDLLWSFNLNQPVVYSPTLWKGVLYLWGGSHAFSEEGSIYAMDPAEGKIIWCVDLEAAFVSEPFIVDDIIFGAMWSPVGGGLAFAVDGRSGQFLWQEKEALNTTGLAVADGVAYLGYADSLGPEGNLRAVDAFTGEQKWEYPKDDGGFHSPVVANGLVFAYSDDRRLYAIDADTGDPVWNFETG